MGCLYLAAARFFLVRAIVWLFLGLAVISGLNNIQKANSARYFSVEAQSGTQNPSVG